MPIQKRLRIDWLTSFTPMLTAHLVPFAALFCGVRIRDWIACIVLYFSRMFFLTAGYHRLLSHGSYETSRVFRFCMALGGTLAFQKGPLWWTARHKHHHRHSDTEEDVHSPVHGFWQSHIGWILSPESKETDFRFIEKLQAARELRILDRFWWIPPILLAALCYYFGGLSMLVTGFFLSTALLYQATFAVNSLTHLYGKRRFRTRDNSRNIWWLALFTCGESWHNNHHAFANSARQGLRWWEVDLSFYVLRVLSALRLVHKLHTPPAESVLLKTLGPGENDRGFEQFTQERIALSAQR